MSKSTAFNFTTQLLSSIGNGLFILVSRSFQSVTITVSTSKPGTEPATVTLSFEDAVIALNRVLDQIGDLRDYSAED